MRKERERGETERGTWREDGGKRRLPSLDGATPSQPFFLLLFSPSLPPPLHYSYTPTLVPPSSIPNPFHYLLSIPSLLLLYPTFLQLCLSLPSLSPPSTLHPFLIRVISVSPSLPRSVSASPFPFSLLPSPPLVSYFSVFLNLDLHLCILFSFFSTHTIYITPNDQELLYPPSSFAK